VYGIITGVDAVGPFDGEEGADLAFLAGAANDMPFAFRVRVEDDALTIKDIKFGPIGSPLFAELFGGKNSGEEMLMLSGIVGGKYKADPNPDRTPPSVQPKPRKK
jgi:hypothetical protein